MTPEKLEMLKKIQPLFTEWNVGDRCLFDSCSIEQQRWGSNDNPNELLINGKEYIVSAVDIHSWHTQISLMNVVGYLFNSVCFLHYPYPHQIKEKLIDVRIIYSSCIGRTTIIFEKIEPSIHPTIKLDWHTIEEQDEETALLKALVWQIENK